MANIGSVNESYNIRMIKAMVDIEVGKVPTEARASIAVRVHAVFTLKNESPETLALTVGFPVSDSRYSAYRFRSFHVLTDDSPRTVFNRVTGYPNHMSHLHISGPDKGSHTELPDYPDGSGKSGAAGEKSLKRRDPFVVEKIGNDAFHNLMVWGERFKPHQTQTVDIRYTMALPLQKNRWEQKMVTGSYKGVWPEEADNLPISFLKTIPYNEEFYFFDYFLVSGASWKGAIGEEIITLRLDPSWEGHKLYSNQVHRLVPANHLGGKKASGDLTYTYTLRDEEPVENLYFALRRP